MSAQSSAQAEAQQEAHDTVWEACESAAPLVDSILHGPGHWWRVVRLGLQVAAPGADRDLIRLFGAFHDCRRHSEGRDAEHGQRASAWARRYLEGTREGARVVEVLGLSSARLTLLYEAIARHSSGQTTDEPTIGACWDGDRLDLVRLWQEPRASLLSTEKAQEAEASKDAARMAIDDAREAGSEPRGGYLYHGTSARFLAQIERLGLLPFDAQAAPPRRDYRELARLGLWRPDAVYLGLSCPLHWALLEARQALGLGSRADALLIVRVDTAALEKSKLSRVALPSRAEAWEWAYTGRVEPASLTLRQVRREEMRAFWRVAEPELLEELSYPSDLQRDFVRRLFE